jgi:hypothetical protein
MSDVDPGVEATIRWREVVNNAAASGEAIHRVARIAYDGDCLDEIAAHEVKVRCAPVFANTISGLPFGLDGILGPSYGAHQRAITGTDFVELPPATPVARSGEIASRAMLSLASNMGNGHVQIETVPSEETGVATHGVQLLLAFDRDRLQRTLRFLSEARFSGLVTHVFAVRAFFPDSVGTSGDAALHEVRETLRETLDRLFIKLRLPNYVIAPRDLETKAARAALEALLGSVAADEPANSLAGSVILHGACDEDELRALRDRLVEAPLSTALPWATLARLIPADGEALLHYRTMLTAALDELASAEELAFIDTLQRRPYPVLDAALDVVRAQLGDTPA